MLSLSKDTKAHDVWEKKYKERDIIIAPTQLSYEREDKNIQEGKFLLKKQNRVLFVCCFLRRLSTFIFIN